MYVEKNIPLSIIVKFSRKPLVLFTVLSLLVVIGYRFASIEHLSIPFLPIGTLGTAVAILLGFRNNSAYDRFWEARKIWGQLVNDSRGFARNTIVFIDGVDKKVLKEIIHRHLAFINTLRMHLRNEDIQNSNCWYEVKDFLSADEFIEMHEAWTGWMASGSSTSMRF
jgi:putative membrane protein